MLSARESGSTLFRLNRRPVVVFFFVLNCVFSIAHSEDNTDGATQENRLSPINVDITTHLGDKQTFLKGDSISFLLSLDIDAYLLAIYEDAAGGLTQLIPNIKLNKILYKSGLFIPLPDENTPFKFTVQAPFGKETLWVFATDVPFPELEGEYLSNGLKKITVDMTSIKKILFKHKQSAFGETKLIIHTKNRD